VKSIFPKYLSEESWFIHQKDWEKTLQNTFESQFAQGNGYLGLRGIMEEVPHNAQPGTFLSGLYDGVNSQVTELVNLPNPIHFKITSSGEKFGIVAMDLSKHGRCLDLKHGLLARHTLYEDRKKRKYDYRSIRFVSMQDKNIIGMQVCFTALEDNIEITVKTDTDVSTVNPGVLTEGWKRHFQLVKVYQTNKYDFVCVKTLENETHVAYVSHLTCSIGKKTKVITDHVFNLKLKKGQTVSFNKIICVHSSNERLPAVVENEALAILDRNVKKGFDELLKRHIKAMDKLWASCDVVIKGNTSVQKAIRFNIYHLLICAPFCGEGSASVGAKTLSGCGYRGHVFWDTEIFLFPFYLFALPDVAKNMLLYRYFRMDAARKNAKKNGYGGAQFPWESADLGDETTPDWAKNFDGRIIQVRTGELEHHIVADIAYATTNYHKVTGDNDFMYHAGYEILFETARFWAKRLKMGKRSGRYEIHHVIGPDEFHEGVNNNAFTNMMARWNLLTAYRYYSYLKKTDKAICAELSGKIRLKEDEVKKWHKMGRNMVTFNQRKGIIEQFEGYFKKKNVRVTKTDDWGMPDFPVGLDLSKISRTQLVKQADVLMMLYLLSSYFNHSLKLKNYRYYLPRTLHKSSLSPSVHSIIANEVGDAEKAYFFFNVAINMDLENIYKNVEDGIHGACLGGAWQAVVNGFGGVNIKRDRLSISPKLPAQWKGLAFSVFWRGIKIHFQISPKKLGVKCSSKTNKSAVPIEINKVVHKLTLNRVYSFSLSQPGKKIEKKRKSKSLS